MITRNLTKFSPSCSHFEIIFEQEEGKRGIPLYQTWHIVESITLYHFTSHTISELHTYIYDSCFGPISVFHTHFSVLFMVLSPFQRFIPILAFYPQFSVLSSLQCFIPISVFDPHSSVVFPFQCFILFSVFYPHFSVLSPFQRCIVVSSFQCFIPISAFYPHFSVLSPFQCFIPISGPFSVSVSAIQFQRFIPTPY